MMIYVNGQEIASLTLGTLEADNWLQPPQAYAYRPEQYLKGLEEFLRQVKLKASDIDGFVLVQGPGSATALRTSHALVNTLAFALGVQIISIQKSISEPDAGITTQLKAHEPRAFALPVYAREPNITQTKRDPLKRKIN